MRKIRHTETAKKILRNKIAALDKALNDDNWQFINHWYGGVDRANKALEIMRSELEELEVK